MKTSPKGFLGFFDVFRGYKKATLGCNGLIKEILIDVVASQIGVHNVPSTDYFSNFPWVSKMATHHK